MQHRRFGLCLALAMLAVRLLVPTGFMPSIGHHGLTIQLCSGTSATMDIPGLADQDGDQHGQPQHATCPFALAAIPSLGAVEAVAVLPIAFAVERIAEAAAAELPPPARSRLRPPAQAPPATA